MPFLLLTDRILYAQPFLFLSKQQPWHWINCLIVSLFFGKEKPFYRFSCLLLPVAGKMPALL